MISFVRGDTRRSKLVEVEAEAASSSRSGIGTGTPPTKLITDS